MHKTPESPQVGSASPNGSDPVRALAPSYYFDPTIFSREKEQIFYRSWQCVCHVSEVPEPGSYFVRRIGDQEIFVLRQGNGGLRAFYNVCMHRAHPLFEGQGRCTQVITCPYHAWCYELDGRLRRAPRSDCVSDFPSDEIRLSQVRVEQLCGFLFINMDDSSASLSTHVAQIDEEIRWLVPGIDEYHFVCEVALDHPCNWKVTVENYSECYHCRHVHGNELFNKLDVSTYSLRIHGVASTHFCAPKAEVCAGDGRDPMLEDEAFASWYVWPNFSLNRQPGGFVRVGLFDPIAIDHTVYRYRYYSDGTLPDKDIAEYARRHSELTGGEDAILVGKVQRGLGSRGYRPGVLIADDTDHGELEHGVRHFQAMVLEALR